jgi:hypothetical protein
MSYIELSMTRLYVLIFPFGYPVSFCEEKGSNGGLLKQKWSPEGREILANSKRVTVYTSLSDI